MPRVAVPPQKLARKVVSVNNIHRKVVPQLNARQQPLIVRRQNEGSISDVPRMKATRLLCFTFSPYDDKIDKASYFERCWRPQPLDRAAAIWPRSEPAARYKTSTEREQCDS